jgi:hypothetical protein
MAQKCMFDPQNIEKIDYPSDKLVKQLNITPDIYKRFIKSAKNGIDFSDLLIDLLGEWKVTDNQELIKMLLS